MSLAKSGARTDWILNWQGWAAVVGCHGFPKVLPLWWVLLATTFLWGHSMMSAWKNAWHRVVYHKCGFPPLCVSSNLYKKEGKEFMWMRTHREQKSHVLMTLWYWPMNVWMHEINPSLFPAYGTLWGAIVLCVTLSRPGVPRLLMKHILIVPVKVFVVEI